MSDRRCKQRRRLKTKTTKKNANVKLKTRKGDQIESLQGTQKGSTEASDREQLCCFCLPFRLSEGGSIPVFHCSWSCLPTDLRKQNRDKKKISPQNSVLQILARASYLWVCSECVEIPKLTLELTRNHSRIEKKNIKKRRTAPLCLFMTFRVNKVYRSESQMFYGELNLHFSQNFLAVFSKLGLT